MPCKHELVDISITFPREITASIIAGEQVIDIKSANRSACYGVGPGRLKIHCRQCGREDYWTADRPDIWPIWARKRFMRVARNSVELMSLVHTMPEKKLLSPYD